MRLATIKQKLDVAAIMVIVVSAFVGFVYASWYFGRIVNYRLSYKSMVEQTVRDMVKQEALKWDSH